MDGDSMSVEEMYRRVRALRKVTRNGFRGELRRAERAGLLRVVPTPGGQRGVYVKMTEQGKAAFEVMEAAAKEPAA